MKTIHWILLSVLFVATLITEYIFLWDYDAHWWNSIPAFYAIFGFVSCVTIIYVGTFIAKKIVNRDIHYYD